MASIQAVYQKPLATLAEIPVQENMGRMANLVFATLDSLAEVAAARRARSARLALCLES